LENYFELHNDGIKWDVKKGQIHKDNIEMSCFGAGYIVAYGVDNNGILFLSRYCIYPTLRTIPNNTHASYQLDISPEKIPQIFINDVLVDERAVTFEINGLLRAFSITEQGIEIEHIFYPSLSDRCNIECVSIKNPTNTIIELEIKQDNTVIHSYDRGTKGVYITEVSHDAKKSITLNKDEVYAFYIYYTARIANEKLVLPSGKNELDNRKNRIKQLTSPLTLDTGNAVIDTMFSFAKIRAGESIFKTQSGLLHSPGGESYYAAVWCNDEIEYAGPWFSITGDSYSLEASMNAYKLYIPFMSDTYTRIPSSIISEGHDIWEGAGDRGDAAMYLYGASMFVLCSGNREYAKELWEAIKWCAEYCERKKSPEGVIMSDSDELEGRFPTDRKANLSTSSLCFGGLKLAAILAKEMGEDELSKQYIKRALGLETSIEEYFGATLHGFETYRYSKGFDTLRSWICLPVCMGINTRLEGTLKAMLSNYLWTDDGMLTCEIGEENTSSTIWDRSTLYAFRSAFFTDKGNEIWDAFESYCEKRLLGDRVPYAVEAYPEGDKRHLSAESALFCRIITEGILGITPEGFNKFSFFPRLPKKLDHLYLYGINAFGGVFDILIKKDSYKVISNSKVISSGENGERIIITI